MQNRISIRSVVVVISMIAVVIAFTFAGTVNASAKTFSMKGKKVFIAGDSVQNPDRYNKYGAYIQRTAEDLKARTITNKAVSCATLANVNNSNKKSLHKQVWDMGNKIANYDYYFIAGGTNDYGYDGGKATPKQTADSLREIINKIHDKNVKGKIIVVTPLYRYSYGSNSKNDETQKNTKKYTLEDYRTAIKKVASESKYSKYVKLIDGKALATAKEMSSSKNTHDDLHPKVAFVKSTIVPNFKKKLNSNYDWLNAKI